MLSEVTGKVYQVLNDCTNTLAAYDPFGRSLALMNSFLPKHTKYVVSYDRQLKHKLVGIELA